ncbi:MAG: amidohydrolase [Deltaproteobacteria bacterium]|jgi:5-methylthioadenosine/S-adenosylhomocysteine deaminase|nr:amidohydrolase [Deltaproteobacteria bacterium]MBW2469593.1 amidohydrolase [Deltaproteobacteria bacterium]MBW2518524.1 amidohydrolase [Deltaproteobacteria bacterium]
MKPKSADILILNGTILTMDITDTILKDGGLAIVQDRIAAIGPAAEFSGWRAARVIDAGGGIIMPGLINTHTHAAMTCFRGLADDLQLMSWLNDHIFPAEARLDAQKVYSGTLLACAEMIMSGTTCFCDMYLFEDAVAHAADDAGMRAVVGEVLYDFDSPNYGPIAQGFEYTRKLIDTWQKHPRVNIAVEPHSAYLCAPELLQEASDLAQDFKLPLVIHLAESKSEVSQIKARFDRTPVEHLTELGVLAPNVVACHCVELAENDIALLKRYDVKVAHNAESNMKLASGVAPIPRLLREGICVGLGTDGCASNNNLDLFLEMDTVAKLHKAKTLDPTVMDAQTVLKMATLKGAQVLGLESTVGSLEPGKKADLIIVDTARPHLTPMYNPVSHMVYAARGSDVTTVIIDGTIVLKDGQLRTMNLDSVINDVNKIAQEIMAK